MAKNTEVFFGSARTFSIEIVKKFVQLGAEINELDSAGCSVLFLVAGAGRYDILKYLLEQGADSNLNTPISAVIGFEYYREASRIDIFKLMIEYGAKINQEIPTLPGENLLTKAMEFGDEEMVELIKEYGGKPTQAYLDAMEQPDIVLDIDTFEDRLVAALRKGWNKTIKSRRKESFFMFGLETDDDWVVLTPYCNTEELAKNENKEIAKCPAAKWAVDPDFKLYGAGQEYTEPLSMELNSVFYLDESPTAFKKRQRKIKTIFENALARLDSEGLFEKSQARENVLVGISLIDADTNGEREMLRILKRLNPPASVKRYMEAVKRS